MAADNPNYPIATAAINWFDSQGQLHIRVYSTDGYNVTERCADGGPWTTGSFNQAGSAVSATCWNTPEGTNIRVYCTSQDKTVEWCSDAGQAWYQGDYTTT